jgi:hypothetical protein
MKKVALITVATLVVLSSTACAGWLGKGKAPPPAPIAPVVTKG